DEGHHPWLTVGQLALGAADEDKPAIEEDDRAEDRREECETGDRGDRVAEPLLDVVTEQDDRDREGETQPELVAEGRNGVAFMAVMATVIGVSRIGRRRRMRIRRSR